jgi:hypothetical protein
MIKHTKYDDEIYSYEMMVDIQKNEERQKTDFVAIKSHEMRIISIDKGVFLEAVKQRLINNREALRDFVNRRPIFIYFIHQTIGGKIKVFCLTVYYWDQIGKDIDEDKNIKSQRSLRTQSKDNTSKLS